VGVSVGAGVAVGSAGGVGVRLAGGAGLSVGSAGRAFVGVGTCVPEISGFNSPTARQAAAEPTRNRLIRSQRHKHRC